MRIDIDELRKDMVNAGYGAFYGGGFGGGLMSASDARNASPEKLVEMAMKMGINIENYVVTE